MENSKQPDMTASRIARVKQQGITGTSITRLRLTKAAGPIGNEYVRFVKIEQASYGERLK